MTDYESAYGDAPAYFGSEPNPFLLAHMEHIPANGRVLDIGVGQGRNSLPLAQRGMQVTGIDMSAAAIEATATRATALGLKVSLQHGDLFDFDGAGMPFDAVLLFGLLQELERSAHARMLDKIVALTAPGSLLLLTAWQVEDPRYQQISESSERLDKHSYRTASGAVRTYLERGEVATLLSGWELLHHAEELGPWHRHGDGDPERHGLVEVVARRGMDAEKRG